MEWGRPITRPTVRRIDNLLSDADPVKKALGCLIVMELSFFTRNEPFLHPRASSTQAAILVAIL